MEISELFDLPAHPLIVHAAVVLLPLAAVVTLVVAAVPSLRRCYAIVGLALAIAAAIFVGLAQGSGEELEERVEETALVEEHASQGEDVLPWAIGLVVVSGAVVALDPLESRYEWLSSRASNIALVVLAVVASIGATWTVVEVGHSGAEATWSGVGENDRD